MNKILEIGPGSSPALEYPGTLLQEEPYEWHGVDAELHKPESYWPADLKATYAAELIVGDCVKLEFLNESFDHVIMRSVFGHYTDAPNYTPSSIDNTRGGLYEAFRVLKPDGKIIIAEENTPESPASPSQTGTVLVDAGFKNIKVYPCQAMQNPHWQKVRGAYWDIGKLDADYDPKWPIDPDWGFVIEATRPDAELISFEATVTNEAARRANLVNGPKGQRVPWLSEATFWRSNAERPEGIKNSRSLITVVTKDWTDNLAACEADGRDEALFL